MAAGLNQSANEVVQASRGTTQDLARATSKFGQDFSNFLEAGVDMAGTSQVTMMKEYLHNSLKSNPNPALNLIYADLPWFSFHCAVVTHRGTPQYYSMTSL